MLWKCFHSICQQIWKTQQWPQNWKRSVFILIPNKSTAKKGSNYHTIALISHDSKILLKILQARLQQYVNQVLPDVQVGLGKQRNQRSHCQHLLDHRKSKKNIYICFTNCAKTFDCVNHTMWKILQQMGIPDHLTCLLRSLYAGKKQQLELDMEQWTGSKLGKEYVKAVYCHPAYLT